MENFNEAENVLFEADKLISEDKIIEAKEVLFEALAEYPNFGKFHNYLGWIYHYKMVDYEKAERHYKLCIKLSSSYHAAYHNFSYLLIDMGAYEEMISFGAKALQRRFVDKGTIYNQLGKAQELIGSLKEAYRNYLLARKNSTASSYMEEINSSLLRVKSKMTFFERLSLINKH
ncbi:conserved hypothetical protein [Tenacibaculum maritimum]|uniref:hypothetical protein n=1 Tax=Tenacibaculum maritimum TaxID=107401 RepID=UPI0012E4C06A|nr:hypothetical protein [Tenacibaculum maritimum]CAA0200398.1 conserved hypothetical protein [Tenacibaculum maritimum]CAA0202737.1 conserved hypothetical protein [Tenacibaculum maritimum]CAA0229241.1 conserved hypothetical protein [Tenacibaculum maritimum]CAA0230093.1 conserved hypothetical protein [Tenacibaculum maritimum]